LFKHSDDHYFIDKELKSVEHKDAIKSLGARYLIKKSILDFLELNDEFNDIKIENEQNGKPVVFFKGKVKEKMDEKKIKNILVSISHSRNFVSTLVIIE
jgi:phosphopantetheinyl transferase (holo-ACP synthase)